MKYAKWQIKARYPNDPLQAILDDRNIINKDLFFDPKYESLSKPSDIPGVSKASNMIKDFVQANKKIGIFGDYDADGICGTAILVKAINNESLVEYYIPDRSQGYGLTNEAVDELSARGVKLLITVDCGIKNNIELEYATSLGMSTIVVDHHQLGDKLPDVDVIVHPLIDKNKNKFREYSGGGVAYMLARELIGESGKEKWLIDLAAISTVADMVPLVKDNRTIVKYGLIVINKTKNIGLKKLFEVAAIEQGKIGTYEIGYLIAPRLNAAGRVSIPIKGLELLVSNDEEYATDIAKQLNSLNEQRQELMEEATTQAFNEIEKNKLYNQNVIVLENDDWNEGVVGLVSGRVTEKYYRPSIILTAKDEKLKGSARSISDINITELLDKSSKYLLSFGGHKQAAGLSLTRENFEKFKSHIYELANKIPQSKFERELIIDCLLEPKSINKNLAEKIEKMEPFGISNRKPIFAFENMVIDQLKTMGKDNNHYRLQLKCKNHSSECIAFNADKNGWGFKIGQTLDIAFTMKTSVWRGEKKVDLIIEDVKEKR